MGSPPLSRTSTSHGRFRLIVSLIVLAALGWAAGAEGRIRTLFVGVDHYAYTRQAGHDPTFEDLGGSVNDVTMIEAALARAYGLTFAPPRTNCGPTTPIGLGAPSVTLLDSCATRRNILAAFKAAIDAASAGDTVLFYFAGHGSHTRDDGDCAYAAQDDTIVQYDARVDANDPQSADIRGCELRAMIGAAPAGVNIVTVFDSCDSGGATRGLAPALIPTRARAAPPLRAEQKLPPPPAARAPPHAGYVHLAAAASGALANETVIAEAGDGRTHGVFSWALKVALDRITADRAADITYADLFAEAGQIMTTLPGAKGQQPWAEAAAAADLYGLVLGQPAAAGRIEPVTSTGDGALTMAAGALSDVTAGSTWGLFARAAGAAGGRSPDAGTAVVVDGVGQTSAMLKALGPPPARGPLWARELTHSLAIPPLRLWVDPATPRAAEITRALLALDAVTVTASHPSFVFHRTETGAARLTLTDSDQNASAPIDPALPDPAFQAAVRAAAVKVARFVEEVSFGYRSAGPPPSLWIGQPDQAPDRFDNPPKVRLYRARAGDAFVTAVTNTAATPRYLYLLAFVDATWDVAQMFPRAGSPTAIEAGSTVRVEAQGDSDNLCAAGRYDLLLLSSEQPIDPALFVQTGDVRGLTDPDAAPLARLAAAAAAGARPPSGTDAAANWGAAMATIIVDPAPPGSKGPCGRAGG